MAKKKKEEVVEKTAEQPKVDDKVEKIKVKEKPTMKKPTQDDKPIKVDLSKPEKTEEDEQPVATTETEDVQEKVIEETTDKKEDVEQPTKENVEQPVLEEITDEGEVEVEATQEQVEEVIAEAEATGKPVPENIQKLMEFMEDTGGDLNDYVKLNQDYDELDNLTLLEEYYKQTKPHLNQEEINFLMEDNFSFDDEVDDEKEIRRKKLALKEQVASAKGHLDDLKSKYYEDLKSGMKLTKEQQEAIEFFNNYKQESKLSEKAKKVAKSNFLEKTDKVFNDKFKGFEYNVGDKKYRFNVNDVSETKDSQSDIDNFIGKFLNEKRQMEDAEGYHKSLFTAMNADAIAKHFYEQGKSDAIKTSVAQSKNINMEPRQSHGEFEVGGVKVKVLGDDSETYKLRIKNKR